MYEINDGYQEIYITDSSGSNLVSPILSFEHGSGYCNNDYENYLFYAEIPKSYFAFSQDFSIKFSAHGLGNDDWVVKDVMVKALVSNYSRLNNNILCFENTSIHDFS